MENSENKMISPLSHFLKRNILFFIFLFLCLIVLPIIDVKYHYQSQIHQEIQDLPPHPTTLVLGAAVWRGNIPSHALEDRLQTSIEVYEANKTHKLLMSGDNRTTNYNEPQTMKNYVVDKGVPEEDVVLDFAGLRTYDSCYRLREIFEQNKVIIVTQNFHLPRAVYTCERLGVDSVGVIADKRRLIDHRWNSIRELAASWVAFWQVNLLKPEPKFLGAKEDVF